jgi:hypothetical protein
MSDNAETSALEETLPPATDLPIEAPALPVREYTVTVPANLRVLLHLPRQSRTTTQPINGRFYYTQKFGRVDGSNQHLPDNTDGGMHVFESRLLTLEEFYKLAPKWLLAEGIAIRPLVRIVALTEDGIIAEAPPAAGPSLEDVQLLLTQLESLRVQNQSLQTDLEAEQATNRSLSAAIEQIEQAETLPDVTQPESLSESERVANESLSDAPTEPKKRKK